MPNLNVSFNLLQSQWSCGHVLGDDQHTSLILDVSFRMNFVPVFLTVLTQGCIRQERRSLCKTRKQYAECEQWFIRNMVISFNTLLLIKMR